MKNKKFESASSALRPKRNVLSGQQRCSTGLSWREETDIQKALYKSLHDSRRNKILEDDSSDVFDSLSHQFSLSITRNKVHAQRKFAQGSNPSSPVPTPIKFKNNHSPVNAVDVLPAKRPKTEDFLTFLCLRGSSILPSSIDYLSNNFKEDDRRSDSRSATPSLWDKSENDSISGNDIARSRDGSTVSNEVNSAKKMVLQSPNKPFTPADMLNFRETRQSAVRKTVVTSKNSNLTSRLVKKAKIHHETTKKNEKIRINDSQSKFSALRQKYKERRIETQKYVGRGRPRKIIEKSSVEPRVTRSHDTCKSSKQFSSVIKRMRMRRAKMKPSIIEYASSDESASDTYETNKSASAKSTAEENLIAKAEQCDIAFDHSYNKKLPETVSGAKVTKIQPKVQDNSSGRTLRRRQSLRSAIMEAAGSTSSSSSSSSSDSESEIRVLRNTRKTIVVKTKSGKGDRNLSRTVSKTRSVSMKKCDLRQTMQKNKLKTGELGRGSQRKKLKRAKESKRSNNLAKNSKHKRVSSENAKKKIVPSKKVSYSKQRSSNLPNRSSRLCTRRPSISESLMSPSSSSTESDSDFEEPPKSAATKHDVIDIDSLIEFSSSDDSLYDELMFLTKRASKELSPKTVNSTEAASSSTSNTSFCQSFLSGKITTPRRSLSIETKVSCKGTATAQKIVNSETKTMCDASTNTCEEDILDPTHANFHRGPSRQSVPPPRRISVVSSSTSPMRKSSARSECVAHKLLDVTSNDVKPFPPLDQSRGEVLQAPIYYPSVEEFKDPLEYFSKISPQAEKYGICTIIPPPSFKPECKVNDDMRFTSHNQHLHKLYKRWGPNVQKYSCIAKHLDGQGVSLEQVPLIGGVELDMPNFYEIVQTLGGLQEVIEKNKWPKVSDLLHIPQNLKMDRTNKLYDIYCKYLVSYDTLPVEEKQKLEQQVIAQHQRKKNVNSKAQVVNDAVFKGKTMALSQFYRISCNIQSMWYKSDPTPADAETDYWKIVEEGKQHVVVHAANIDSSVFKSGFPSNPRNSVFAKHPWNLKVLTNNASSVLRCVGPVSGVTIPTLHIGMLFTSGCWYQDPHGIPWIEYLHAGAPKIWYGIPQHYNGKFQNAMKKQVPNVCRDGPVWLPSDTAMVPPSVLCKAGVSLSKITQEAGQFVIVFPRAYTATICCGYSVAESVYFALPDWLDHASQAFRDLNESCEPATFSLDKLLVGICNDPKIHVDVLVKILLMIDDLRRNEDKLRKQLLELGLKDCEYVPTTNNRTGKRTKYFEDDTNQECEICQAICHLSLVVNSNEQCVYCLNHAIHHVQKKKNLKYCKLVYMYDQKDFENLIGKVTSRIDCSKEKLTSKKLAKK